MDRDIEIAAATWADLDGIHRLEAKSFPSPWRREFFESELSGESRVHFVARRRGSVVGYVFAMWFFDEMHVNKIAVLESERRKGIADALMER
ncbi:MAG TPA: GNAT family N-acetyltransferase, partial [Thermoanaerobaculia bacterium]|nr:GNAT family N-acetyltransferase [Thermoanaerobaculia bacterium]